MNAVQRFFRRYILSTVGIVLLFFAVNIALLFVIIIAGGMSGADTSFSVRDFSDHVVLQDGKWVADDTALSMLQEQSAWAMLLNEDGDYPVKIWTRADGKLMVVGYQPGTLVKYYFSLEWPYMGVLLGGIAAVFIINLLLIIFLILRNTRKVEKAMTPILQGIQNLSHGICKAFKI